MRSISSVVIAVLVTSCAPSGAPPPHIESARPPAVQCHARADLPDPECTPGDVETTDLAVICGQSTRERRNVTEAERREGFARYGVALPVPCGAYEFDHLVSLELGGSNAPENLWPQPAPAFHEKDAIENAAHRAVCAGTMTAEEAQRGIARDWRELGRRLGR